MSLSFVVLYFLWLKPSLFVVVLPCDAIEPSPPFSFSLVHLLLMAIAEPFLRQCHDVPKSGFSSLVQLYRRPLPFLLLCSCCCWEMGRRENQLTW